MTDLKEVGIGRTFYHIFSIRRLFPKDIIYLYNVNRYIDNIPIYCQSVTPYFARRLLNTYTI